METVLLYRLPVFMWFYLLSIIVVSSQQLQYNLSTSKILNPSRNLAVTIEIKPSTNKVSINITGPDSYWFGIGFNATDMENTYAIVCAEANKIEERKLGYGSPGTTLPSMITILSDNSTNGIRSVSLTRNISITSSDYFTFPTIPISIPIIDAIGTTLDFNDNSDMNYSDKSSIFFNNGLRNNLSALLDISTTDYYTYVNISVFPDEDIVQINFTGPTDLWYGIGFNSDDMPDTYAIVCSSNPSKCQENKLGDDSYGTQLDNMLNIITDTVNNQLRTVIMNRKRVITMEDSSSYMDYYQFPSYQTFDVPVIHAYGQGSTFTPSSSMHSNGYGPSKITFNNASVSYLKASMTLFSTKNEEITIYVYPDENIVDITFTGPVNVWYGIGFDAAKMDNAYSIICQHDNIVQEQILGNDAPGNKLTDQTITITKDIVVNDIRTVTLSRPVTVQNNPSVYDFPTKPETVSIIYAYGTTDTFNSSSYMGQYAIASLQFYNGSSPPQDEYNLTAESMLYPEVSQTVSVAVYPLNDTVNITLTGPDNLWFGVGFNATDMPNAYAIVCSENNVCEERHLAHGSPGMVMPEQHITKLYDASVNGTRKVILSRKQTITSNDDINYRYFYDFPSLPQDISIIYSYGINNVFVPYPDSDMSAADVGVLSFRNYTKQSNLTSGKVMLFPDVNQSVIINIYPFYVNMVEIIFNGPSSAWFGIGFNNTIMNNTYAIICESSNIAFEQHLIEYHAGYTISQQSINIESDVITNGVRTVTITRPLSVNNDLIYDFPISESDVDIIAAYGPPNSNTKAFNESYMQSKYSGVLKFTEMIPSNGSNNASNSSQCKPGVVRYGASGSVGHGLSISLYIYCNTKTIELGVNYTNYRDNWFGIVFNDRMTPSPNSTVFTTGKPGANRPLALYAYDLEQKTPIDVVYKKERDWLQLKQIIHSKHNVSLLYSQDLSKTKWNTYTNTITFRYAWGTDLPLVEHDSTATSSVYTFNLVTGAISSSNSDAIKWVHGITMITAWSIFTVIGIYSSAFRFLLYQKSSNKALWFFVHRGIQVFVVILVLLGFGIAIYFTQDNGDQHFDNTHEVLGLMVVIFCVLQPVNAWFRPHPPKKGRKKSSPRLLWEILHKSCGYATWILSQITIVYGIKQLTNNTTYEEISIVYSVCIAIIYVILSIYNGMCFINTSGFATKQKRSINNKSDGANSLLAGSSVSSPNSQISHVGADNDNINVGYQSN